MNLSRQVFVFILFIFICKSHAISTWLPWNWGKDKVNGVWSEWSSWSACQNKELQTFRYKERSCTNPPPKNGGTECKGISRKTSSCQNCNSPLGFESRKIIDKQLSASSWHEEYPPGNARLNTNSAWCSGRRTQKIYFQVDLKALTAVSAIASQGYHPSPSLLPLRSGRVSKYRVAFSRDGTRWELYKDLSGEIKVFRANEQRNGTVLNNVKPEIITKFVRIYPAGYFGFICMRLEFYGCWFNCGGYLTNSPGNISIASSKTVERDCLWQISLPSDTKKIFLDFIIFNVPCENGIVEIRSGKSMYGTAPILGQYCDIDETPPHVSDTGRKLWIHFKSNSSDPRVGFLAKYRPNCGKQMTANNTELKSLNFPGNYFHNLKCGWTITAKKGKTILMKMLSFDVTGDRDRSRCPGDLFSVRDGFDNGSPLIGRFCNSKRPPQFICSSGSGFRIKFKSDDAIAGRGFHVTFREIEPNSTCADPIFSSTLVTLPSSTSVMFSTQHITTSLAFSSMIMNSTIEFQLLESNKTSLILQMNQSSIQTMASVPYILNQSSVNASSQNTSGGEILFVQKQDRKGKKDDDDDDDDALTTIIVVSVFSFIVLCMIIVTVTPNIIHHMAKRKQQQQKELSNYIAGLEDGSLDREGCEIIPMLSLNGENQTETQQDETLEQLSLCESTENEDESLLCSTAVWETQPNEKSLEVDDRSKVSSPTADESSFSSNSSFAVEANYNESKIFSGTVGTSKLHQTSEGSQTNSDISQGDDFSINEEIASISQSPDFCSSQVSQDSLGEVTSCDLEYDTTDLNFPSDENMDVSLDFAEEMETVLSNFMKTLNLDNENCSTADINGNAHDGRSIKGGHLFDSNDNSKELQSRTENADTHNENLGGAFSHDNGELGKALTELQSTLSISSSDSDTLSGHIKIKPLSETKTEVNNGNGINKSDTESDNPLWELQPDWQERNDQSQSEESLKAASLSANADITVPYTLCFNDNKDSGCPSSTSTDNIPFEEDFHSPMEPSVKETTI